eukprot:m51a1_g6854 hypothetical protein (285) ;mRNA; f:111864-112866
MDSGASLDKKPEVKVKHEPQDDPQAIVKPEPRDDLQVIVKPEPKDDSQVAIKCEPQGDQETLSKTEVEQREPPTKRSRSQAPQADEPNTASSARWIDHLHCDVAQTAVVANQGAGRAKRRRSRGRRNRSSKEPQKVSEHRFVSNFVLDPQKTHIVNHEVLRTPMAVAIGTLVRNGSMWLGLSVITEISTAMLHAVLVVDMGSDLARGVCGLAIANHDDKMAKFNDPRITGHKAPLLWLFNVANNHYPVELPASTWDSVLNAVGDRQLLAEDARDTVLRLFEIPL